MAFGQKIERWRKSQGLTQRQLGEKLGLSHQYVSQHERELGKPSEEFLQKTAELMGVTYKELMSEDAQALRETGPESDVEIWRRRAQAAEKKLADLRSGLRHLIQVSSDTPLPEDLVSSGPPSDAGLLLRRAAGGEPNEPAAPERTRGVDAPSAGVSVRPPGASPESKEPPRPPAPAPGEREK